MYIENSKNISFQDVQIHSNYAKSGGGAYVIN